MCDSHCQRVPDHRCGLCVASFVDLLDTNRQPAPANHSGGPAHPRASPATPTRPREPFHVQAASAWPPVTGEQTAAQHPAVAVVPVPRLRPGGLRSVRGAAARVGAAVGQRPRAVLGRRIQPLRAHGPEPGDVRGGVWHPGPSSVPYWVSARLLTCSSPSRPPAATALRRAGRNERRVCGAWPCASLWAASGGPLAGSSPSHGSGAV